MYLTLVVPAYNEEKNVARFYEEVARVFADKVSDYEFVFVDDGSRDRTYEELCRLNEAQDNVRVLSFSRNFGKESAIYAGLEASRGELVCLMDADLQQRPEVVLQMLSEIEADGELDCVTAYQEKRREGRFLSAVKSGFYKLISRISDVDFVNGASDFRLMRRAMVESLLQMTEYHRFSKGLFGYVGFRTKYIPYVVAERERGSTKWSVWKLMRYALDGIISFSTAPLKLSTFVGFFSAFSALVYLVVVIIQKLAFGIDVPGYATIVVLLLLIGGIQLFCMGILGSYIAKMHIETKKRPIYILRRTLESKKEKKD